MEKLQHDSINDYFYLIAKEDCFLSFRLVYNHYYSKLFNQAIRSLHDPDSAQKAVVDIFVSLWINRKGLDKITDPDAYFLLSLKNAIEPDSGNVEFTDFQADSGEEPDISEKYSAENTFDVIEERISDAIIGKMKRKNWIWGVIFLVVLLAALCLLR